MAQVKIIGDINELKWFFDNIMPPLLPSEVYFLSLSARNKYLTEDERKSLELGRTEMFQKTIVRERSWERLKRTLRKMECDEEGYTTKNNSPIPSKCIVCYLNINPSDTLKALNEFNKVINEYMFELSRIALKKLDSGNIMNRLNKVDNNMLTAYQQATGTRYWIDIDCDVNKEFKIYESEKFKTFMIDNMKITRYYFIDTKSGYHIIIDKTQLKNDPNKIVEELTKEYIDFTKGLDNDYEIILNKNNMIPMPGTLQADHIVRVINKE